MYTFLMRVRPSLDDGGGLEQIVIDLSPTTTGQIFATMNDNDRATAIYSRSLDKRYICILNRDTAAVENSP